MADSWKSQVRKEREKFHRKQKGKSNPKLKKAQDHELQGRLIKNDT
jgi:hypothetical protein